MGFFSEIKKLLFVKKSVAKSAADKAVEAGKETGGKILDSAGDFMDDAKDSAGDLADSALSKASETLNKVKDITGDIGEKVMEKTGETLLKGKEIVEDFSNKVADSPIVESTKETVEGVGEFVIDKGSDALDKAKDLAEDVGSKVLDATTPVVDKTKDLAENIGATVLGTGGDAVDKAKGLAEDVGEKVLDKGGKAFDRVKEVYSDAGEKLSQKAKDFYDAAQEDAAKEAQEDMVNQANSVLKEESGIDKIIDDAKSMGDKIADKAEELKTNPTIGYDEHKGSLLDGQDDFFAKAERFAEGDYHNQGAQDNRPPSDVPEIVTHPDPSTLEPAKEVTGTIKGFEDLDGDGDELVDDAIILDNNPAIKRLDDGEEDEENKDQ